MTNFLVLLGNSFLTACRKVFVDLCSGMWTVDRNRRSGMLDDRWNEDLKRDTG